MNTSHFNKAQKRVNVIKDELTRLDLDHLDTFLDGATKNEPPNYQWVDGVVQPPLELVALKKGANSYTLGNVFFHETGQVKKVIIRVEEGNTKVDQSDRLPRDERNFLSTPILQDIANEFLPVWKAKYLKIVEHRDNINDKRHYVHDLLQRKVRLAVDGKAPGSPHSGHGAFDDNLGKVANIHKRAHGEPVARHPSNKRPRLGLDAISDSTKCETFAKIQDRLKVDLFDAMIKTAVPGFDNVMIAAWNVVSLYRHIGSPYKGFNTAIIDLKSVLEEFEATHGATSARTKPQERTETQQNGIFESPFPPKQVELNGVRPGHSNPSSISSVQKDSTARSTLQEIRKSEVRGFTRRTISKEGELSDQESRKAKHDKMVVIHRSKPRYTPTHQREGSATISSNANGHDKDAAEKHLQHEKQTEVEHIVRENEHSNNIASKDLPEPSISENQDQVCKQEERDTSSHSVLQDHQEQQGAWGLRQNDRSIPTDTQSPHEGNQDKSNDIASPTQTNKKTPEANNKPSTPNQSFILPHDTHQEARNPHAEKPPAPPPIWLGNSKLGAKKISATNGGAAPVAPMLHTAHGTLQHSAPPDSRKNLNTVDARRP